MADININQFLNNALQQQQIRNNAVNSRTVNNAGTNAQPTTANGAANIPKPPAANITPAQNH